MSYERAKAHLDKFGLGDRIRLFDASSATVALAAAALGTEEARIAKSLSFAMGDGAILVIAAGDAKIDNARFRATFGMKARMLDIDSVERLVGHAVGGVCPFGVNDGVRVYLGRLLCPGDAVFPPSFTSHASTELTIPELERASLFDSWVDVTRVPDNDR